MSITAILTGIIVLLIRRIKKIPRRVISFLWLIPLFRMWLPFGIGSKFALMTLISKITTKTVIIGDLTHTVDFSMTNHVMAANSYFPIIYKTNILNKVFGIGAVIWLIIGFSLIISFYIIYIISLHELKSSKLFKDNVYYSEKLISPAVYGIFRPRIILPDSYREQDLTFVLLHEKMHIKRGDNIWRILAFITAAVHWFNPLSWIFLKCFLADLELSCDEKVLAVCNENGKSAYARAILNCAESRNAFISAFGGAKIRIRIENIISYRKISVFSAICFSLFVIAIAYMLLTNAI
ncbi:MAG: M56 family metallopeptidase [Eubacteriales bacterium]|nr:M56 family metallopeptidase [Eubacteriales bacterium]